MRPDFTQFWSSFIKTFLQTINESFKTIKDDYKLINFAEILSKALPASNMQLSGDLLYVGGRS